MDNMMDENTFVSWFSHMNVPQEAFTLVLEEIMQCASIIVDDEAYVNRKFLTIQVDFSVARAIEEEEEENNSLEENEEITMFEEEYTSICLEDVDIGVPLPCSHIFHKNCIQDCCQYFKPVCVGKHSLQVRHNKCRVFGSALIFQMRF
ncbi:hypothetical protein TSUD_121190 [Trifolium subterraneum]|nr:hypothetical protein TSUD_121190 [Trifolium subterraneum]